MSIANPKGLFAALTQVEDPRSLRGRRHPLPAILAAVVSGYLCGKKSYKAIVDWLHDLPIDFSHFLGFTRWPPNSDCFRELFRRMDSDVLEQVLTTWVGGEIPARPEGIPQGTSLDGKTLRGSSRFEQRAAHLLSLVDHETRMVLSQIQMDPATNEHKAAMELLKTILLKDRVITADAMFCHRDFCQAVVDSGGDYLISVKANQPALFQAISQEFAAQPAAFSPLGPAFEKRRATAITVL